jgi:hypothetical protein
MKKKPSLRVQRMIESGKALPPLGKLPEALTDDEVKAWGIIVLNTHDGVLRQSDGIVLSIAARLYRKAQGDLCKVSELKTLRSLLFKFGIPKQALGV